MPKLQKILEENFKLKNFREGQKEVVESVVNWTDTLVFMPTWGWKSLTYQLPAIARNWVAIIISPLISLMKDQVDKLNSLWIKAKLINSTISYAEQQEVLNELSSYTLSPESSLPDVEKGATNNRIKFLYIAPERLNSGSFLRVIQNVEISLVAIDEAHCISQWWHDFRPSYMRIKSFLDSLKNSPESFPIVALTATATKKVRADIVERLWLNDYKEFTKGFDRKNIIIIVREISKKDEKLGKVLEILEKTPWSWIIYCSSRKAVNEVYEALEFEGIAVWKYTWAMTPALREEEQNKFMNSKHKVVVATNAFWMGIDKADIRFVIHYNLPWSIENYYQEVGRAGRDWKTSYWIVLASYQDTKIQEFFIENIYPPKYDVLEFYDYLYKGFKTGEWQGFEITKTQKQMAKEAGLKNDMMVSSILKIFEKYWIIKKWISGDVDDFRGRWLTLTQEKRNHSNILVDWSHQEKLEEESYYKLEQIKKLLFYPSCRKRFILEYFSDEEDLENLWDNCKTCDFCIDKKKFESWVVENIVPISVFEIILEVVNKFDSKFWVWTIVKFLWWSGDKKILEWQMDKKKNFWVFENYTSPMIQAFIEALISVWFLEKSIWQYPMLKLTNYWRIALNREDYLKEENTAMQHFLKIKLWNKTFSRKRKAPKKISGETYLETLKLFNSWKNIDEITSSRDLKKQTIENHIIKLYETERISLAEILKLVEFSNLKEIKKIMNDFFSWENPPLKEIRDKVEEYSKIKVERIEINISKVMIKKGDL